MRRRSYMVAVAMSVVMFSGAHAAVIQVQSDILDYEAYKTVSSGDLAISNGVAGDNRIGSRTRTTLSSSILPFALPTILSGEEISSATLNVTFKGESSSLMIEAGDGNVDLYGLPYQASPVTQSATRYYSGPNDSTAGVTKLQDNFFTADEYPAENTTLTKASVDISAYLKSLYAAGAVAGDFAVIRLSYDIDGLSDNNRYRIVTSGGDGGTIDASPHSIQEGAPFLSITTSPVPEPTSLVLLGLAVAALIGGRRR